MSIITQISAKKLTEFSGFRINRPRRRRPFFITMIRIHRRNRKIHNVSSAYLLCDEEEMALTVVEEELVTLFCCIDNEENKQIAIAKSIEA